ncbi:MAG: hypothetical protein NVSMB42_14260 [Herpetosiphon sp.]
MGFLRRLFGGSTRGSDDGGMYLYARCGRCGAVVQTRVDLHNDLSVEYGEDTAEGYHLRKELMDDRCFRVMHAELVFDRGRQLVTQTIDGGNFIAADEYVAAHAARRETGTSGDS